jgi:hypothetical protein
MPRNIFLEIAAGKPPQDLMRQAESTTDPQLESYAENVEGEVIPEIGGRIAETLRSRAVTDCIIVGFLLWLFYQLTNRKERRELFPALLADVELSRTQALRAMAVWTELGRRLLAESNLLKWFTTEALKILAEKRTSEDAREQAFAMPRRGERVTIKVARALQRQHAADEADFAAVSASTEVAADVEKVETYEVVRKREPSVDDQPIFEYTGDVVEIRVYQAAAVRTMDVEEAIRELETALALFREQHATATDAA